MIAANSDARTVDPRMTCGAPPKFDGAYVVYRLEEAGATLLSLPPAGPSTRLRMNNVFMMEPPESAATKGKGAMRPATPSAARITRMDQALAWINLIPKDRVVLRRIVGARAMVSPLTERHLFSWRRLGILLGADHKAVQRWHGQGVDMIVAVLAADAAKAA